MEFKLSFIYQWLLNTPYRALDRAYNASKMVRNIQAHYIFYKEKTTLKCSWYNIALYMNTIFEESVFHIYCGLLEFKVSKFLLYNILNVFRKKKLQFIIEQKFNCILADTRLNSGFIQHSDLNTISLQPITRKMVWIEAAFHDLNVLRQKYFQTSKFLRNYQNKSPNLLSPTQPETVSKGAAYESIGLVPRSISRTFARFQTELADRSALLILSEFRLVKYQANASIQYIICLLLFPWVISTICKVLILQPLVENYWNTAQYQVFINASQQQQALTRLQEIEELFWLDIVLTSVSPNHIQTSEIHQKTIELVSVWNRNSIYTILHLLTDLISITCVGFLLILGKKRLAILNSWIQELFYSLSDTMKAFCILLFTDLCIGFHSPHGWEMLIAWFLEHLGFAHNKHIISCFVSTFPVILDTVFKYWIFRHLNRISPSIVVTYHTMNE